MAYYDLLEGPKDRDHRKGFWLRKIAELVCYNFVPPKNSVNVGGFWRPVVPVFRGPQITVYKGRSIPAWWLLECGRLAEFLGIFDGAPISIWKTSLRHGEVVIDGIAVFRVTERRLGVEALAHCAKNGTKTQTHISVCN